MLPLEIVTGKRSYLTIRLAENQMSEEDDVHVWSFEAFLDYRKTKHGAFEIQVLWTTGKETWEPLTWIGAQDHIVIVIYVKEHNLNYKSGWKRFKMFVNRDKKFIRMVQQINKTKSRNETKIKFGIEVPRNYQDAMRLDRLNTNTSWVE